eukprot:SAG11_NODE_36097_length_263_cov_0.926829_1_plen_72_part_01
MVVLCGRDELGICFVFQRLKLAKQRDIPSVCNVDCDCARVSSDPLSLLLGLWVGKTMVSGLKHHGLTIEPAK